MGNFISLSPCYHLRVVESRSCIQVRVRVLGVGAACVCEAEDKQRMAETSMVAEATC